MAKKTKVHVGDAGEPATNASTSVDSARMGPSDTRKTRKGVAKLSHDISTEQLLSDELIDGKVADGDDDDSGSDSDGDADGCGATVDGESDATGARHMYRIESHSALSSLDAKRLDKTPSQKCVAAIPATETKATARPTRLAPLPGSPTTRSDDHASPFRTAAVLGVSNWTDATAEPQLQVCSQCAQSREMPPMHSAAYSGHANCLGLLLEAETESPMPQLEGKKTAKWLDKKQRTPLFYACAANQLPCARLLARARRVWLNTADRQLDTPVHVCCFFGWHECLQLLLDTGADPHGRNAKGFKPSHLAATPECLEALLAYGDDLLQGDKLGRSPLFVACARDRSACVEFLCAWNHQTRAWMLEQEDQRGDRAIHAAACNGSAASLAVLLRYGADALAANAKGMSPRDLARTNNHPECEALLLQVEQELAATAGSTWFAPANAASGDGVGAYDSSGESSGEWVQCWDHDSGEAFYYNNLTGKCQWEAPQQLQIDTSADLQAHDAGEDDSEEYVWVKKKKQAVCVVTSRETEWTAVQDPVSRAIYYKNARTGQSQWEEPDAVRQLASAVGARTSQEASRVWEQLDAGRGALAAALAREKRRQLAAHEHTLQQARLHVRQRREDIAKREEQARLAQLLPRSSFVRRKKQSMMMKVTSHNRQAGKRSSRRHSSSSTRRSSVAETFNENEEDSGGQTLPPGDAEDDEDDVEDDESGAEARLEEICAAEPALDIFLSTYLRLRGVRDLQVLTTEKRLCNCLFHYYVALVDPVKLHGVSKSQFRVVLRDAHVIPGGAPVCATSSAAFPSGGGGPPPLKLHVTDLIFAQAERAMAPEGGSHSPKHANRLVHRQPAASPAAGDSHLSLSGFTAAMQIVRERVVAQAEEQAHPDDPVEIDDDEEWFLLRYLVPLALRLGARLLTQIRRCKELELQLAAPNDPHAEAARRLVAANRAAVQLLHRHYSRRELEVDSDGSASAASTPKAGTGARRLAMLTFRGLALFATDFSLLSPGVGLPALHFLLEAVNWISGTAHTEVISFEKFQQLLIMLAVLPLSLPNANSASSWIGDNEAATSALGGSSSSSSSPLVESISELFKRLADSPALLRVTAESSTSGERDEDSRSAVPPSRPQSLFVLEVPTDDAVDGCDQH